MSKEIEVNSIHNVLHYYQINEMKIEQNNDNMAKEDNESEIKTLTATLPNKWPHCHCQTDKNESALASMAKM